MKLLPVITALLLITGCSSNNVRNGQQPPSPSKVTTHAQHGTQASTLTQASSISTPNAGKSSIMMQQAPNYPGSWTDLVNRYFAGAPAPTTAPAAPAASAAPAAPAGPGNASGMPQRTADSSQFAQQVLNLVNQERSKAGLQALSMNSSLSNMAMAKAQDMYNNNYFDHQSPTYGSPFDMMRSYGITYTSAGENIAKGQSSPTEVMVQWMNSPGHRANILNSSFTQIGIAYYSGEWVQEFIG